MHEPLIVFDADCVLCSRMVAFVRAHERQPSFHFVRAWSSESLAMAAHHGFSKADLDKIFLVMKDDTILTKSGGGRQILHHLKAPWRWLKCLWHIAKDCRDIFYSFIAERRYAWFGHRPNCVVIPKDWQRRFKSVNA